MKYVKNTHGFYIPYTVTVNCQELNQIIWGNTDSEVLIYKLYTRDFLCALCICLLFTMGRYICICQFKSYCNVCAYFIYIFFFQEELLDGAQWPSAPVLTVLSFRQNYHIYTIPL